jgi:glycosyltransferase involved in cell wall biosynthesis
MHILLIHQSFAALDEAGGTRHHELARFLASRGHQVTVIASPVSYLTGERTLQRGSRRGSQRGSQPGPSNRSEKLEPTAGGGTDSAGVTIRRTYTLPSLHRSFLLRVISFLSFMVSSFVAGLTTRRVDLVWGTSPPIFQGISAWLLARLKGVPYLFEVRDLWPSFAIGVGVLKNPLLIRLALGLEGFLYRHADRVMVNSPGYIDHVLSRGARWVELVPNGADPDMFDPAAKGESFRGEHSLGDRFIALYAGAHGMSNDLTVILQAASQLRSRPDIHFVFLGDGKEKSALMREAQALQLENVKFIPSVPKLKMAEALAAADACIAILKPIPQYRTTYPNKVFDYMAAGRPVILAIDGCIREVVEESGAGIAVQPGDASGLAQAVVRLAEQPDLRQRMGEAGRKRVERDFSRNDLARKLSLLIEEMRWMNG